MHKHEKILHNIVPPTTSYNKHTTDLRRTHLHHGN
jgi:hypothetical protein